MDETTITEAESRADIYQRITDRIVTAIEAGAGAWRMPWHTGVDDAAPVLPVNAASRRPYRGVNTVVLWATARAEAYPSAVCATYRQWAELGAKIRKGERASPIVFWKISTASRGRRPRAAAPPRVRARLQRVQRRAGGRLPVAARNHNRPDAQSRALSDAH